MMIVDILLMSRRANGIVGIVISGLPRVKSGCAGIFVPNRLVADDSSGGLQSALQFCDGISCTGQPDSRASFAAVPAA